MAPPNDLPSIRPVDADCLAAPDGVNSGSLLTPEEEALYLESMDTVDWSLEKKKAFLSEEGNRSLVRAFSSHLRHKLNKVSFANKPTNPHLHRRSGWVR